MAEADEIEAAWDRLGERRWIAELPAAELCAVIELALQHDDAPDAGPGDPLFDAYDRLNEIGTPEQAIGIENTLAACVRQRAVAPGALLTIALLDNNPIVVANAARSFATHCWPIDDDPLFASRHLLEVLLPLPRRDGPAFAGLASLGDSRLVPLLLEAEPRVDGVAFAMAAEFAGHTPSLGCLEFWLACAERFAGLEQDGATMAGRDEIDRAHRYLQSLKALARIAVATQDAGTRANHWNFGFPWTDPPQEPYAAGEPQPLSEAARPYADRLRALEAAETFPYLLPSLLPHFGLAPLQPPETTGEDALAWLLRQ